MDPHAGHYAMALQAGGATSGPRDEKLPAADEQSKAAINSSPRHGEWVDVKVPGSPQAVRTWVVYPERKDKAPVVIVIHEIYGMQDWIRGVADQLAKEGFIAVAPDLVSGKGPNGGNSDSVPTRDDVTKLVRALSPEEAMSRLNAVRDYALKIPAANGKTATVGFCWGGSTSFAYAAAQPGLNAAVVYYGTAPTEAGTPGKIDASKIAAIKAPVLGLYGGDDARVNATIDPTEAEMKKAGKAYEHHVFDGAGHGFLRAQADRNGANMKASQEGWPKTVAFIRQQTK
jgi:carboxymethylenebutenolidase